MFTVAMHPATMNRGRAGTHAGLNHAASSPESAVASELFDQFVAAGTFKAVLSTFRQICEVLRIKPTNFPSFYPRLKAKLRSWKAASLWSKIDKRASHKCYNRGKACPNTRILIIGAGPCGLRTAIEAQLLGAKVVVIEKRDRFSRNNVLHLWPFVIHDLRNLGAKKFFGKFCAGAIDHISIRQLQLILLKVALLLGVEVHENVSFKELLEPPEDQSIEHIGWRAAVLPQDHPVHQYEFDVLIGADGKRNTLHGFNRKEFRGKLAIAVTANFINRHTMEEARIPEISGVAFIFNQKFFQDMKEQTGIDLENIVYYKDDTHYFVMTAKKQSLLERGVIIKDYSDTARLLAPENVDREALMEYARDAADFATNYQMPHLEFAVNHYGQADVAMFDFTSMYAAESASRVCERRSHKLLQGLVGDSLLEPFWPTGSGCARGFLSAFDAAWMIRSWASGKMSPSQVLAERESVYRLLAQTTPENLSKDFNKYSLNPASRYPNLNTHAVLPSQIHILYDTDSQIKDQVYDVVVETKEKSRKRRDSIIHPEALQAWCQRQIATQEDIRIENMSESWKNGMALCAIIHHYRPDLIDLKSLNPADAAKNNQLAFDICEREFGIPPIMTGQEMADCDVPDTLAMVSYVSQIYETFRGEIPYVVRPTKDLPSEEVRIPSSQSHPSALSILSKIGHKLQNKRRYSLEREAAKDKAKSETIKRSRIASALISKRRSRDKDKGIAVDMGTSDVTLTHYAQTKNIGERPSFTSRVQTIEEKILQESGLRAHQERDDEEVPYVGKGRLDPDYWNIKMLEEKLRNKGSVAPPSPSSKIKVGRIQKDDWNVKMLEERLKQKEKAIARDSSAERPKVMQEIFESKLQHMDARLKAGGGLTADEEVKFGKFDMRLKQLDQHLKEGSNLDVGVKGSNWVSAMAEHMAAILENKPSNRPLPPVAPSTPPPPTVALPTSVVQLSQNSDASGESSSGGSEVCYFCRKRVYLMERLSAQGLFFHRSCFRCEYCNTNLRLQHYAFDPTGACGGKFYCYQHFRKQKPDARWQEMMRRKEAFLSGELDRKDSVAPLSTSPAPAFDPRSVSPKKEAEIVKEVPEIKVTEAPVETKSSIVEKSVVKQSASLASHLLTEPSLSSILRDRTPERVEYENSLELSEEELLTSELEEEELTQKNLGSVHEVATSDDEYSDLSTDSESEEEAYAEELERSLTADETRKLAENWKKRYSKEPSLPNKKGSSDESEEEGSSVSEESTTETGSAATSGDIDSDVEYSTEEEEAHKGLDLEKTPVQEKDLLNCLSKTPSITSKTPTTSESEEETSDLEDSEELSDSDDDSESEESEPEPPKHQIPTIIIEESPPQDNVEDWAETAAAVLRETAKNDQASESNDVVESPSENQIPTKAESEQGTADSVSRSSSSAQLGSQETLITSMSDLTEKAEQKQDSTGSSKVDARKTSEEMQPEEPVAKKTVHPPLLNDAPSSPVLIENAEPGPVLTKNEEEASLLNLEFKVVCEEPAATNVSLVSGLPSPNALPKVNQMENTIISKMPAINETNNQHLDVDKSKDMALSSNSSPGTSGACQEIASEGSLLAASDTSGAQKSREKPDSWNRADNEWFDLMHSPIASCSGTDRAMADSYSGPPDFRKVFSSSDDSDLLSSGNHALRIGASEFLSSDSGELKAQTDSNHQSPSDGGDTTNISYELSSDSTENNLGKTSDQNDTPEGDACFEELPPELSASNGASRLKASPNGNDVLDEETVELIKETNSSTSSDEVKDITDIDNISDRAICPVQSLGLMSEPDADEITHSDWAKDDLISGMEDFDELSVDPTFITVRKKNNKAPSRNIFLWDEDDDDLSNSFCDEKHYEDNGALEDSVPNDLSEGQCKIRLPTETNANDAKQNGTEAISKHNSELSEKIHVGKTMPINIKKPISTIPKITIGLGSSPECSPSLKISPAKFQGYSGSFAEKVRPRSLVGDSSIYLKSLNINLQKLDFPSLTKPANNSQLNASNENLSRENRTSESFNKYNKNDDANNRNQCSKQLLHKQVCGNGNVDNKVLLFVSGNKRQRAASQGESSVSSSTSDHSDSAGNKTKSTPGAVVLRQGKRQQNKEQRLSVHDVESVPFADEELRSLCEDFSSPEELIDVFHGSDERPQKSVFQTPSAGYHPKHFSTPVNQPNIVDEIRLQRTAEQERARQQARERARLKSDEELGLSPKNYRKKYGKMQPSVSHYEELISGDFLDEGGEGELEDEMMASMLESPFLVKRVDIVSNEAQQSNNLTVNAAKQTSAFTPESSEETTASSKSRLSAISPGSIELLSVLETASSNKTTPTTDTSKTDGANYLESSISVDDIDVSTAARNATLPSQTAVASASTSKGATSESSPEIMDATKSKSPFPIRPKVKVTSDADVVEKPKTPSKKTFFSLLSFGKNNSREKKEKSKEMDKERSASLPADLAKKTPPKERSFPRLKLPRSREKSRDRHKKKYQVATDESGKSGNSSRESILDNDKPTRHVDFSPTPPPLKLFFDSEPCIPPSQLLHLNPLANGIAPKASEDSFSDTEEEGADGKGLPAAGAIAITSLTAATSSGEKREKAAGSKEAKAQRVVQKVHRQQELKRLRAAQEIQRQLEELEIKQRELEERGVEVEKALRGEGERVSLNKSDTELMQDWFDLVHEKSKILREEQELLIRAKDLELEDRHSRLQQDMRERMARDDAQKSSSEIEEEGKILAEMLEIVEKRDELVVMLDQLRVKEVEEDKNFESKMVAKGLQFSPACKS